MTLQKWHLTIIFIISWALSTLSSPADTTIALEGNVPRSITDTFLLNNYSRIWKAIAPGIQIDKKRIHIIFYSKNRPQKSGSRLPEWGGGGAIGTDTIIVPLDRLALAGMDAGRVAVHELVHIALERAYGGIPIPRWFHEGLAMTLSGELLFDEQVVVSRAILTHRLLPFAAIDNVNNHDQYEAALAYSQSHLAVAFLIDDYGIDTIPELLKAVRATGNFDSAMQTVLGFSVKDFEGFAGEYVVKRYSFVFLISDTALYWFPITFLFIAAFVAVTIRNKKKRKRMEEEERREDELAKAEAEEAKETRSDEPQGHTDAG